MLIGVVKETYPDERRVALVPTILPALAKAGLDILVERGAGDRAGFADGQYEEKGARLAPGRREVFAEADIVCQVRTLGANPEAGRADTELMRADQVVIGIGEPLSDAGPLRTLADAGVTSFALELMPRITRAQSMDVLSSQATVAGYKAVLLAAMAVPRMMPMMMTAAGTLAPAKTLVIGAGVAGLQAIATARRLGAVVSAYDIRTAVKEQIESLGAKFVEMEIEAGESEDAGGYAKAMDEDFYRRQRELMTKVVADSDVVITTAAVPGKQAPVLVTAEMVRGMAPGSVVVDLAAERGGNCELTKPGETIVEGDVTIIGPLNLATTAPYHASQMYAKNMSTFLLHLVKEGALEIDESDEITGATLVTRGGQIVQPMVREVLGLGGGPAAAPEAAVGDGSEGS